MNLCLQKNDEEKTVFLQKPIEEWVLNSSFEKLCFSLLEPLSPPEQEVIFHEQAVGYRGQLALSLAQKRPLFAPVMATLQSLASSLTVYQHDWAYYNQLLMSFAAFFQEDLRFYEQTEQQLFVAGARQSLRPEELPFVSSLMNLWAIPQEGSYLDLLKIFAQAQVEMPAAIASCIALQSSKTSVSEWMLLSPWIESLSSHRLQYTLLMSLDQKKDIPGFRAGPLKEVEKYLLAKQIAGHLAQQLEVLYPTYQLLLQIEAILQEYGWSPCWETYAVITLHALGLYPNWLAPWSTFCRLPVQIAQYRLYEQDVSALLVKGAL